jgi:hypothetical protein
MEGFVNETQAKEDVVTTFITVSLVFFGMVVAFLLLWAYNKSDTVFFMAFVGMVAIYAFITVVFVAIIRSNITSTQFKVFMISSVFMAILSIVILLIFVIKTTSLFRNVEVRSTRRLSPIERVRMIPQRMTDDNNMDYSENRDSD